MIDISEMNPTLTGIRKTAIYCFLTQCLLIFLWVSHWHIIPAVLMLVIFKNKNSIEVSITRCLAAFTDVFCKKNNKCPCPVCFSPLYFQCPPVNFEFFKMSFCKDIRWWWWFQLPSRASTKECACVQCMELTSVNVNLNIYVF